MVVVARRFRALTCLTGIAWLDCILDPSPHRKAKKKTVPIWKLVSLFSHQLSKKKSLHIFLPCSFGLPMFGMCL